MSRDMEYTIPRCFKVPKQSFFLFGPRGTGKSTLLRALWKDALWVDLLEPDVLHCLRRILREGVQSYLVSVCLHF